MVGLNEKSRLTVRLLLELDGFKIANSCQLTALPCVCSTVFSQWAAYLDGDVVGKVVAVLVLVAPVRRDAQDGIGQASVLVFLQGNLVGQVPDCDDFNMMLISFAL